MLKFKGTIFEGNYKRRFKEWDSEEILNEIFSLEWGTEVNCTILNLISFKEDIDEFSPEDYSQNFREIHGYDLLASTFGKDLKIECEDSEALADTKAEFLSAIDSKIEMLKEVMNEESAEEEDDTEEVIKSDDLEAYVGGYVEKVISTGVISTREEICSVDELHEFIGKLQRLEAKLKEVQK